MRFKLTIVLLLANLAVFFVLWKLEQPAAPVPVPPGPIARDFNPDHVVIVDHANNQSQTREFKLDPATQKWAILQPITWPASEEAVTSIYRDLQFLDVEISFSMEDLARGGQSLKDFGLDHPLLEVTLSHGASAPQKLLVGSPTVYAGRLYVMNPADHLVRVISQGAIASLYTPLQDLRDNHIFTTRFFNAKRISILTAPNKVVQFIKDKNTELWQLDAPLRRPADSKAINSVVAQLGNLTVLNLLAPKDVDLERQGLTRPKFTVELAGDTSQKLSIGEDVPNVTEAQVYAQMEDKPTIVFTLRKNSDLFDTLLQAQDKLRQRLIVDFDPDKVVSLDLASGAGEIRILRVSRTWQIQGKDSTGPTFDADPALIQGLLDGLHGLAAKTFASDAPDSLGPFGLDANSTANPPLWKVTLRTDKPVTLTLGRTGEKAPYRFFAKTSDTDSVYEINGEFLDQLDTNPLSFRDRVLEQIPTNAFLMALKLTDLKDNHEIFNYTLPDNKTTWEDFLKAAPALANDPGNLRRSSTLNLRDALKTFSVDFYRQAAFSPGGYSLSADALTLPWRFRLDVDVEIPAVGQTPAQKFSHQFYFSDKLPKGVQIGGTPGDPTMRSAVFNLKLNLVADLDTLTSSATVPADVQKTLNDVTKPINPNPPATTAPAPAAPSTPGATPAPANPAATAP